MPSGFIRRLMQLCDTDNMAEVSRCTSISYNTLKNYVGGTALPSAEILIQIARNTGGSLDWLLMGEGEMFLASSEKHSIIDETAESIPDPEIIEIDFPAMSIKVKFPRGGAAAKIPLLRSGPQKSNNRRK